MKDFSTVKNLFQHCVTPEDRYQKIIELGRALPPMSLENKHQGNIVRGCQSILYLQSEFSGGKMFYHAASDSLISSGLAALLIKAYSGEDPEVVIKYKPLFLDELQILSSLSPGRSNGIANMYLRMQKEALKFLASV